MTNEPVVKTFNTFNVFKLRVPILVVRTESVLNNLYYFKCDAFVKIPCNGTSYYYNVMNVRNTNIK